MSELKKKGEVIVCTVAEAFPNILFKVEPENGEPFLAYLSGKMCMNKIRVLVGDRVEVEIDPYGGKGRITRRL